MYWYSFRIESRRRVIDKCVFEFILSPFSYSRGYSVRAMTIRLHYIASCVNSRLYCNRVQQPS